MMTYIKLGKIRSLFIEINKEFGTRPVFRKNTFHYETIIDIPYGQIIYTSGQWRPKRKCSKQKVSIRSIANGNKQTGEITKRPKRICSD
jgi:hypothetical protein